MRAPGTSVFGKEANPAREPLHNLCSVYFRRRAQRVPCVVLFFELRGST